MEGTGSIVFDYLHNKAFACRSVRTNAKVLEKVCSALGYRAVIFDAVDKSGVRVYHTNVLMWIGTRATGICLQAIENPKVKEVPLTPK